STPSAPDGGPWSGPGGADPGPPAPVDGGPDHASAASGLGGPWSGPGGAEPPPGDSWPGADAANASYAPASHGAGAPGPWSGPGGSEPDSATPSPHQGGFPAPTGGGADHWA